MKDKNSDTIYAQPSELIEGFQFDQTVVNVFPDMINRSVPGYSTIIHMIGQLAERYVQSNTNCYDLGCSLGAATLAMRHRINTVNNQIISVDNSKAMIERCQAVIDADAGEIPVSLHCANIQDIEINNASMCVLNFTLQFIPIADRLKMLSTIAEGMVEGGVLVISEKLAFEDQHHNELMIDLHHNFKKSQGYSELEIAQKRAALENVLIPETYQTHQQRLVDAGFRYVDLWFQCFNFSSFIAFK